MKGDLRNFQILFLSGFLYYGIHFQQWNISIKFLSLLLFITILTQGAFCLSLKIPVNALKSALITGLGIGILLRSDYMFIYGLVGFFSIASKYIFNFNKKHFFNPANFGIIVSILLTGRSEISDSEWGNNTIFLFLGGSMCIALISRLKKIDLPIFFLFFYLGLTYFWNIVYKGWPVDFFIQDIKDGSFIVFSFFMITDPSSTPNNRFARIIWVLFIAIFAFYLTYFKLIKGAPLYALFALSPMVPVLNQLIKGWSFSWDSNYKRKLNTNAI